MTELTAVRAADGSWTFDAITAAANIPAEPPPAWFEQRQFDGPTPLTFTADGQVFGHIADRSVPHIGLPGHRTAPRSKSGYRYFHTGQVRCADGSLVSTGRLTMQTGHASLDVNAETAAAHYDNTGTAVADVIAWDDEYGVACAGAARPGTTPEQMRMAMASPPSGDWRGIKGSDLEMVAALLVNVPGFPTPRANIAASGAVQSLVAAGVIVRSENSMTKHQAESSVVAAPPPPPATPDDEAGPAPEGAPSPGDMVQIGDTGLAGQVIESDEDGVHVEVVCDPADLVLAAPEDSVAASAVFRSLTERVERAEAQLRESQADRLLASVPAPE